MGDLEKAMRKINKKSNKDIMQKGAELREVEKIRFPSPRLDYILYGGIPMRRITEISGKENSGKTTTALGFCAKAQEKYEDKKVVYVDAEQVLDKDWAETIGVNTDELILMRPESESGEEILEYMWEIIDTGEVSLIVLDSVPALTPKDQLDESIDKDTYAGISGAMTRFTREVIKKLENNNTALLVINQLRDNIGNPFANHRTPGGRALKHYASLRLFTKKGKMLDSDNNEVSRNYDNPSGHYVEVKIQKTKVCKPDRPYGLYTLNFNGAIDYVEDTIEVGLKSNVVIKNGAWYKVINPETGEVFKVDDEEINEQGRTNFRKFLDEHPEIFKFIEEKVYENLKDN